jgi:hypothetical protein
LLNANLPLVPFGSPNASTRAGARFPDNYQPGLCDAIAAIGGQGRLGSPAMAAQRHFDAKNVLLRKQWQIRAYNADIIAILCAAQAVRDGRFLSLID